MNAGIRNKKNEGLVLFMQPSFEILTETCEDIRNLDIVPRKINK